MKNELKSNAKTGFAEKKLSPNHNEYLKLARDEFSKAFLAAKDFKEYAKIVDSEIGSANNEKLNEIVEQISSKYETVRKTSEEFSKKYTEIVHISKEEPEKDAGTFSDIEIVLTRWHTSGILLEISDLRGDLLLKCFNKKNQF